MRTLIPTPTLAQIKRDRSHSERRQHAMALYLIESKARKLLRSHANLDEFVMTMGGWVFTRKAAPSYISSTETVPVYAKSFSRMMEDFDAMEMKVTGEPMRFTANGPVIRSWGYCDGLDGHGVAKRFAVSVAEPVEGEA